MQRDAPPTIRVAEDAEDAPPEYAASNAQDQIIERSTEILGGCRAPQTSELWNS